MTKNTTKTTKNDVKNAKKVNNAASVEKVKNDAVAVEKNEVKVFNDKVQFFHAITKHFFRGEGVEFKTRENVKQMIDKQGNPSPRWYFYTNEKGGVVILELKTNHKQAVDAAGVGIVDGNQKPVMQRVAYHYPLDNNGNFEGGEYDAKEVPKFVKQAAINYIITLQVAKTKKAGK